MKIITSILSLIICISLYSCSREIKEDVDKVISSHTKTDMNILNLKKRFCSALLKVIKENKDVRSLIKKEALKKIDYDYDVLYSLIKDEQINDGISFEDLLSQHLTQEELDNIPIYLPTLTIFIPTLPEDYFSAEKWDIENEVPAIAIQINKKRDILIYHLNGEEEIIPIGIIPAFPILVVKENERIVKNTILTRSNNSLASHSHLQFIDKTFDNTRNINANADYLNINLYSRPPSGGTDPSVDNPELYLPDNLKKIIDACNVYPISSSGWQRDYVYYDISPNKDKGPFNYNFKEYLVGFEMLGNGTDAYYKISDQDEDPKTNIGITQLGNILNWTDGEFEFKAKVYLGNKNAFGNELITFFRVNPNDLFSADTEITASRPGMTYFKIKGLICKRARLDLPLFEWNLENYSANIKIAIEEVDGQETTVETTTTSSEFATNFNFDAAWGETVKIGAKFGTSYKETRTISFQITKTRGNDELGEIIVNFADPIILDNKLKVNVHTQGGRPGSTVTYDSEPASYNTKYSTGWYRLYITPKRIY